MRCEIVAVGTELLLGQVVDTNSAWMGEQLALAGIDCTHEQTVGDNLARIVGALELALGRADAVIVCGGLGPTQDDITRNAIAQVLGVRLVQDDDVVDRILERFAARGRRMPANNLLQAQVPEGATAIAYPQPGTAPGLICPVGEGGKVIYAVPGVPYEMQEIVTGAVLPDMQRRAGRLAIIRSRVLRTWGDSESGLAERLAEHMAGLDDAGP
ncbi:MAG TPA: molybdopterin-binding protein, partial [Acidimicrobiales bacterium]